MRISDWSSDVFSSDLPLHIWKTAEIPNLLQQAPQLPDQIFDVGVLHGSRFAGRIVQEAIFEVMGADLRVMKNGKLDYDGIIGPATRSVPTVSVHIDRSEEHTSELQSLMRISYAVFCLKKKRK